MEEGGDIFSVEETVELGEDGDFADLFAEVSAESSLENGTAVGVEASLLRVNYCHQRCRELDVP